MKREWRFGGVEDGKRGRRKFSGNRLLMTRLSSIWTSDNDTNDEVPHHLRPA